MASSMDDLKMTVTINDNDRQLPSKYLFCRYLVSALPTREDERLEDLGLNKPEKKQSFYTRGFIPFEEIVQIEESCPEIEVDDSNYFEGQGMFLTRSEKWYITDKTFEELVEAYMLYKDTYGY